MRLGFSLPVWACCTILLLVSAAHGQVATIWIGTATSERDDQYGVFRADMDLTTGGISRPTLAARVSSPGFVVVHPSGHILYTVCNLPDRGGPSVAAFGIAGDENPYEPAADEGPQLHLLSSQPIGDGGATHLAVDPTGKCLFTAQYGGGSAAVFPLDSNGSIRRRSMLVEHAGSGPNKQRQKGPHPHWVGVDPANEFLFVPDLGIDQVVVYRTDLDNGSIERVGAGLCPPGAGPRHMKFSADGRFAYVLNELELSVTVFSYQPGALDPIQTISTLPDELVELPNKASEIRIHPTGNFIYAANRGHDSIAVFRRDLQSGRLTFVELEAIRGSWPRNFNVDPSGKWLVAAGRNSNTLTVFQIDQETGGLIFTGRTVNCPAPICVEFQLADRE